MDERIPAQDRGFSFSEQALNLYREALTTHDATEREALLIDVAVQIAADSNRADQTIPEALHGLVNDLDKAQLAFEQAAFSLIRAVTPALEGLVGEKTSRPKLKLVT